MRLRHLSEKTAFLLLGFLVLGACGKDDPEPPVPGSGEGLLRVSVRHTGDTPLAVFAYKADGSRVAGKEEPAGTPSTWSWSERLVVGEYALLVAGADPAEVRLGDTENLGKAYAAALPSGSDSLLVSLDSPLYVESVTGIKVTDERSGSLSRRFDATETPLIHKHLLTQLSFRLRVKGAPDGYSVHAVKLNGLASVAKVSLSDGEVVPVGETSSVIIYSSDDGNGIPVVDGVVTLPGFVLVQPKASLTLDMTLALEGDPASGQDFKDLPVSFGGEGNESGGAYDIEISLEIPVDPEEPDDPDTPEEPKEPDPFEEYQVKITATVTPWKPGNGGNADL